MYSINKYSFTKISPYFQREQLYLPLSICPAQFKCYVSLFFKILSTCLNHSRNDQIPVCMQLWICFLEVSNFLTLVNGPKPQELMEDNFRGSCLFPMCFMNNSASNCSERSIIQVDLRVSFVYCSCFLQDSRLFELLFSFHC